MNNETMTTDQLLKKRLDEIETELATGMRLRSDHLREAKELTDEFPPLRLERNRLRRALGLPCKATAQEADGD